MEMDAMIHIINTASLGHHKIVECMRFGLSTIFQLFFFVGWKWCMRYDFSTNFQLFLGCVCDLLQQLSNKQKFTPKNKENVSNSPLWTKKNCWKFVGVHNFSVGRGFENLLTQLLFSTNFQQICWKFVEKGQIAYTLVCKETNI